MKTSSAKAKGKRLTSYVAKKLLEKQYRKHIEYDDYSYFYLQPGDIKATTSGETGRDVQLSPLAETVIPFDIEGKNCETASPWAWMKQAKANTKQGRKPCVIFTRNREGDVYAMVRLDDLIELL